MFGILSVIGSVASAISTALTVGSKILSAVATAFTAFANALGVTNEKDPKNLGDKVIQAEEADIVPENYDSYADYMKAVDAFEVDEEKSKTIDENEKVLRALDVSSKALIEKYPDNDMEGLLMAATLSPENQEYFTSERFGEIAKEIQDNPEMIDSLGKLLQGKEMGEAEYYELVDTLTTIERRLDPEKTDSEISERIRSLG